MNKTEKEINKIFREWVNEMKEAGYVDEGVSLAEDGIMPTLFVSVPQLMMLEMRIAEYLNEVTK